MSSTYFGDFRLSEIGFMSSADGDRLLTRPIEMPIGTLQRAYFIRPLQTACLPLTYVLLDAFKSMSRNEAFYRNECDQPPDEKDYWSLILNGRTNGEAKAIEQLVAALKKYAPNDTPYHAECFRVMDVCIKQKINYLQSVFGGLTTVFSRCKSVYSSAMASLIKPPSAVYTVEERDHDVDRLRDAYETIDKSIVSFLSDFEERRLHPERFPAASSEVKQVADDVHSVAVVTASTERMVHSVQTTVKRIDNRDLASRGDARKQKCVERIRIQDVAATIFDAAKKDYDLRMQTESGKFSFEVCFTNQHYREELQKLGIDTVAKLQSIIRARNNRLYRERLKQIKSHL